MKERPAHWQREDTGPAARDVCARCERPRSVCLCAHLVSVESRTRVLLLQHPRESEVAIGTARLAAKCLANAELHVGISFEDDAAVRAAISDPARPAALLWPGPGAVDVLADPPSHPITLVVVDGTWPLAKKLVRMNPSLARLPRYAFAPPTPSEYRIRREPRATYVSTIEAIVHVLSAIEGDRARFESLLAPFRAMVDIQLEHQARLHGSRHARRDPNKPPRIPVLLRDRAADLLCVHAEANAWPYDDVVSPDELVQWVACRVATGEIFEALAAPTDRLAPATPIHTRLGEDAILGAPPFTELAHGFASFVRASDVVCSWGRYAPSLFVRQGGALPAMSLDLRAIAGAHLGRKPGSMADFLRAVGADPRSPSAAGRGGERLGQLVAIVEHLVAVARGERGAPPRLPRRATLNAS